MRSGGASVVVKAVMSKNGNGQADIGDGLECCQRCWARTLEEVKSRWLWVENIGDEAEDPCGYCELLV